MKAAKIAISIDPQALEQVDDWVRKGGYPNRSRLIQAAVVEKLDRLHRVRLAEECSKLDPEQEKAAAEEFLVGETQWPLY